MNYQISSIKQSNFTHIRLHLQIPGIYHQEPIISRLISDYQLVVNITGAILENHPQAPGYFDIELSGTIPQIHQGLKYLESLKLQIKGKGNFAGGDSWFY
ncbi:NIL domain-containing protein [Calothrix sp. 336/3]|uniref:NIL domain-containing protein n=1 Tax=Calothrix sp. 336/3 TaxID=1337936 RepID=UPI0004E3A7FB|nr:NIL domain-containing protein [Calothrix sp. 336/3]AKG20623.1 metal ABC transporter ATPase [Calothrix sp. 336/3]